MDRIPKKPEDRRPVYLFFLLLFLANTLCWMNLRETKPSWANVPPVPTENGAEIMTFSDKQLAYRTTGVMLQNLGDMGGRSTAFAEYDYERLGRWFMLADELDPVSNYMPYLAAFYYGATRDAEDLNPVIDYLAYVGRRSAVDDMKWRWLAHASYLARFSQNDLNKALELSGELAEMDRSDLPGWARQMPAFIMMAKGDKAAAFELMVNLLKDGAQSMNKNEVNFMHHYICDRILTRQEAAELELCKTKY